MIDFNFSIPTEIKFGRGTHLETGTLVRGLGRKVLIHYGSDRIRKSGLLEQIEGQLKQEGVAFVEWGGVRPNPSVEDARKAAQRCKAEGIDCILAIGGGSVVDSAKAIAMGARFDGDLWSIYCGEKPVPADPLPVGVVLTIPATGSEANGVSVLSNYELGDKAAIASPASIPKFAVLNPELTLSIPQKETAIAAADIFSHCFERYFDLRRTSRIWDELCEGAMRTVAGITPSLLGDLKNYDLRSELMWSATVAHSNMLGPGGDFACHGLAHVLTVEFGIPHGAALALIMPAWSSYAYPHASKRFDQFAATVWGEADGLAGIEKLTEFLRALGLAASLGEWGVVEFDPEQLADKAFAHGQEYLGGGLMKITRSDAEAIYHKLVKRI